MEIIPLISKRDVAIQRARVAQDRDVRTQAKACLLLGRYYKEQGELHEAEVLYQRALAKARQWQDREMEADAYSGLGLMYQVKGRMDKAVDYLNKAFEINREHHDEERLAVNYSNRGFVAHLQGKIEEAQALHTRAQQLHEVSGNRAYWAEECGNLGSWHYDRTNQRRLRLTSIGG